MHQTLMVQSLANQPEDFVEHILGWNKTALKSQLMEYHQLDEEVAGHISEKIMGFYAQKLEEGIELKATDIAQGDILQIQVGTMNVEGYRETFWDPAEGYKLLGEVDLTKVENLEAMGVRKDAAEIYVRAVTEQLDPLLEEPKWLFQSKLGLAVLEASWLIFGPEGAKNLAEMVKDPEKVSDYQDLYDRFAGYVHTLRDTGSLTLDNGLIFKVDTRKSMGFIEKCQNFALRMNEDLLIGFRPGMKISTETKAFIEGLAKKKLNEIDLALTLNLLEEPGKPERPDDDDDETTDEGDDDDLVAEKVEGGSVNIKVEVPGASQDPNEDDGNGRRP